MRLLLTARKIEMVTMGFEPSSCARYDKQFFSHSLLSWFRAKNREQRAIEALSLPRLVGDNLLFKLYNNPVEDLMVLFIF